ncbi:MAG: HD domain-containing protein [Deltaproteobacteria bacterium]|nr:HD domain-containing protein [Deltaproteobacteria bacterium]TLN03627.1 MAG: HD domain-containing protein [bacterium]
MNDGNTLAEIQNFVRYVVSAVASASLYSPDHRQVHRLGGEAFACLQAALAVEEEIVLLLIEDELVCNKIPLDGSLFLSKFIQIFHDKGIEHLKFLPQVEFAELWSLIVSLSRQAGKTPGVCSTPHVQLGRLDIAEPDNVVRDAKKEVLSLQEISRLEKDVFAEVCACVRENKAFGMTGINEVVSSSIQAFEQMAGPLHFLEKLLVLDEYTFTHSTNVCILNLAQAKAIGIEGRLLHDVGVAALLHDIGKLFVPEEIIAKPGALSPEERVLIQQHPVRGAHYLLATPGIPKLAVVCSFEHHLKYDGTGYPEVSVGWTQNLCSQITAVSDYFDALRTKRSYRGALEYETVAAMMVEASGTFLHPLLTRNFLNLLGG